MYDAVVDSAHMDATGETALPGDPLEGIGPLQGFARATAGPFLRRYFRMEVEGAEHMPPEGPLVLVANHESMWDIPLLVVASPRPIVFMAKQGVYNSPFNRWFFTRLGGFPVRLGGRDPAAVRKARAVVRAGRVLGIYPEGTRVRAGELGPFRSGAARIALGEGVPIMPAAMRGTGEIWPKGARYPRPARVRVRFGAPIHVERIAGPAARRERARTLTEELRAQIESLGV